MKRSLSEDVQEVKIRDSDRDSLHILPLSILPIETLPLRQARMIKNARLESVVEFFSDEDSGSGQRNIENVGDEYEWPESPPHPDLVLLRKLEIIPSYDVYSLRILLRQNEIPINDLDALKLSNDKVKELTEYMSSFTRPLIAQIYGSEDMQIQDFGDIINLFRDPDVKKAREKLDVMADKLGIQLQDVPTFLEDYGDIFLSLSYYRSCLDGIEPIISEFLESIEEIRKNYQLKNDRNLMKTCNMMQSTFNELMAAITGRFESFDKNANDLWNDMSAEKFKKVREMIESYHTTIGGTLCVLSVKMDAWSKLFPNMNMGGPVKRSEFMVSEMRQGLDKIKKIEDQAPMLSGV